jgi:hypothetical protein
MWDNEKIEEIEKNCNKRLGNYYEKLKESGLLKKTSWWVNTFKKGRIYGLSKNQLNYYNFGMCMDSYISCLKEVYGDDWDFEIEVFLVFSGIRINIKSILIYYRDIEITNITKNTHKIKGLLVKVPFHFDNYSNKMTIITNEKPYGVRLNFSFAEYVSSYSHSHLIQSTDAINTTGFKEFCTGTSDIVSIPKLIAEQDILSQDFKNYINLFLFTLDSFVKYESLEGRPYVYFEKISENIGLRNYRISFSEEALTENFKKYLVSNKNNINFNYEIKADKYFLLLDDNYKNFIKNFLLNEGYSQELVIKKGKSLYAYEEKNKVHPLENGYTADKYVFINGVKEFLTVFPRVTDKEDISFYTPSEKSLKVTKEYVEYLINNKANDERIAIKSKN